MVLWTETQNNILHFQDPALRLLVEIGVINKSLKQVFILVKSGWISIFYDVRAATICEMPTLKQSTYVH